MKVMVAGIGNVFLGDDGFGCEVIAALLARELPPEVRAEDYGIRAAHLAVDLMDDYDLLVLVDALAGEEAPGTIRVIEPDPLAPETQAVNAHSLGPAATLQLLARMGGKVGRVVVVGCQPASLEPEMGLSAPVRAAVEPAVRIVESLLAESDV
jgi:hydrogenase maturation protease